MMDTARILIVLMNGDNKMKYKLVTDYPDGQWHLINTDHGNEWTIIFDNEMQMLQFMKILLEE